MKVLSLSRSTYCCCLFWEFKWLAITNVREKMVKMVSKLLNIIWEFLFCVLYIIKWRCLLYILKFCNIHPNGSMEWMLQIPSDEWWGTFGPWQSAQPLDILNSFSDAMQVGATHIKNFMIHATCNFYFSRRSIFFVGENTRCVSNIFLCKNNFHRNVMNIYISIPDTLFDNPLRKIDICSA